MYVHAWLHYRIPLTWAAAAAGNGQVCRTIITGQIAHSTSCYSNGSERSHCCHCTNRFIIFAKLRQRAPQSNTWLIRWANASMPPPNGISVGSAAFARLTVVTGRQIDRHTDRPRHGVCSNRPQLCCKRDAADNVLSPRNVRRILVRGSMPPCRLRRRKF